MKKTSNKNENLISCTPEAISQFKKILSSEQDQKFVRLLVDSGGCSGFSYKFSVDSENDKLNDIILLEENNKIIFLTDKISFKYIKD